MADSEFKIYACNEYIGGGLGALDKLSGPVLKDKDKAVVINESIFAPFHLDADSAADENSPLVIKPDVGAGEKRWHLKKGVFAGLDIGTDELVCGSINRVFGVLNLEIAGVPTLQIDNSGMDLADGCGIFTLPDAGLIRGRGGPGGPTITFGYSPKTIIFSDCKIGVGGVPASELHLVGGAGCNLRLDGDADGEPYLYFMQDGVGKAYIQYMDNGESTDDLRYDAPMHYFTGGKVGVGGIPVGQFHVHEPGAGVCQLYISTDGDADVGLWFNTDANGDGAGSKWAHIVFHQADNTLRIGNSGVGAGDKHIVIAVTGKVGVNDFVPASQFDVDGDINTTVNYKVDDLQVVSNRGAAVADATDAPSVILRLNELLARCRTHGLIAS